MIVWCSTFYFLNLHPGSYCTLSQCATSAQSHVSLSLVTTWWLSHSVDPSFFLGSVRLICLLLEVFGVFCCFWDVSEELLSLFKSLSKRIWWYCSLISSQGSGKRLWLLFDRVPGNLSGEVVVCSPEKLWTSIQMACYC